MARPFDIRLPPEQAYRREAMLAVELVDPVTLERVAQGVTVTAIGLAGLPIVNFGGLFVWLKQPDAGFRKLVVDPGMRPFAPVEVAAALVQRPLHTVELQPLANYPFTAGLTALRGSLVEHQVPLGGVPQPVAGATIRLEWLHEDGTTWVAAPARARTGASGEFTIVLRHAPSQVPALDAQGRMSVRLFAARAAGSEKHQEFQLPHGRVADAVHAWDELV